MKRTADLKSQSLTALSDIYVALLSEVPEVKLRDIQTFRHRLHHEGLSFVTTTMPLLGKAVDKALGGERFVCPSNFKCRNNQSALPSFLGSLFGQIFTPNGELLQNASVTAVWCLRQLLFFCYKLDAPYKECLVENVLENFIDVENELCNIIIDDDSLLKVASMLVNQIFHDYDRDNLAPKHGPGKTSNFRGHNKFDKILSPLHSVYDFGNLHFFNHNHAMDDLSRFPTMHHDNYFHDKHNEAQVIFVPKDSRGPRLISCEPVENQFVQQALMQYMVGKLESKASLTFGHVNFTNQTINRELAREGSLTLEYSTLDLKDASDRVSLQLVEKLYRNVPSLLSDLLRTRSSYTRLPDGRTVKLSKFAPMGSACCFPVMATCIWAILCSGIYGLTGSLDTAVSSVYVYGDDIIVKTSYAEYAKRLLERYHLRVNHTKSFINSRFLESCGMDAFDGNDVSPIRMRAFSDFSPPTSEPAFFVRSVELANSLFLGGFSATAEKIYRAVENTAGPLPASSRTSPYVGRVMVIPSLIRKRNESSLLKRSRYPVRDSIRYPYGYRLRAWTVTPSVVNEECSPWAHLTRTYGSLGQDVPLPKFGEFAIPKRLRLTSRKFDHYSM